MRTKNFLKLAAMMFERHGTAKGLLSVTDVNGNTCYISPTSFYSSSGYPYSSNVSVTTNATSVGISIGSGNTAATENDINLESTITSGFTATVMQNTYLDEDQNPCCELLLTITNTSGSTIVINEIGMKQNLYVAAAQYGTSMSTRVCLIDRTVLDTPVMVQAGGIAVVKYTLKTEING